MNIASSDIVVVLPGAQGTQAELEIALGLVIDDPEGTKKRPVIVLVDNDYRIGSYTASTLPHGVVLVQDE